MPSRFAGAGCAPSSSVGLWNLMSSSLPLPSGVFTVTNSTCTSSRPTPSLAIEPQFEEERGRGLEVVDDDTYMIGVTPATRS